MVIGLTDPGKGGLRNAELDRELKDSRIRCKGSFTDRLYSFFKAREHRQFWKEAFLKAGVTPDQSLKVPVPLTWAQELLDYFSGF